MKIGETRTVSYAPRSAVRDWLNRGWRFIPGVEYRQGEYAVLMAQGMAVSMSCCVAGCDDTHEALGLCARHYKQLRRTGLPFEQTPPGPKPGSSVKKELRPCSEPGCAGHAHAFGLCRVHYLRQYRASRRARELMESAA